MTNNEYLNEILDSQTLDSDGDELKLLRKRRDDVEILLRDKYGNASSIRSCRVRRSGRGITNACLSASTTAPWRKGLTSKAPPLCTWAAPAKLDNTGTLGLSGS